MAGHLGSFGRALAARARRRRLGNEGAFDEAADRLGSAGPVGLPFGPCVNALFKITVEPRVRLVCQCPSAVVPDRVFSCYWILTPL